MTRPEILETLKRGFTPIYLRDLNPQLESDYNQLASNPDGLDLVVGYYLPESDMYTE